MSSLFFPSFIYSTSWEDFDVDLEHMKYNNNDNVLTLTGGGCNSIHIAMQGANVVSVDMNPAQNHLLELKISCARSGYQTLWSAFGEGSYCDISFLNLSPDATSFFAKKCYFAPDKTIYYHGGMGIAIHALKKMQLTFSYLRHVVHWTLVKYVMLFLQHLRIINIALWYIQGVPNRQLELIIKRDGRSLQEYLSRTLDVFDSYDISDNHYYYLCQHGNYSKTTCPLYLKEDSYQTLVQNLDNITIAQGTFMRSLYLGTYTKVVLMDHMDWNTHTENEALCILLQSHITRNGKILLRSSSLNPPHITLLKSYGFNMSCINSHANDHVCDKVNMYASTWIGVKN